MDGPSCCATSGSGAASVSAISRALQEVVGPASAAAGSAPAAAILAPAAAAEPGWGKGRAAKPPQSAAPVGGATPPPPSRPLPRCPSAQPTLTCVRPAPPVRWRAAGTRPTAGRQQQPPVKLPQPPRDTHAACSQCSGAPPRPLRIADTDRRLARVHSRFARSRLDGCGDHAAAVPGASRLHHPQPLHTHCRTLRTHRSWVGGLHRLQHLGRHSAHVWGLIQQQRPRTAQPLPAGATQKAAVGDGVGAGMLLARRTPPVV